MAGRVTCETHSVFGISMSPDGRLPLFHMPTVTDPNRLFNLRVGDALIIKPEAIADPEIQVLHKESEEASPVAFPRGNLLYPTGTWRTMLWVEGDTIHHYHLGIFPSLQDKFTRDFLYQFQSNNPIENPLERQEALNAFLPTCFVTPDKGISLSNPRGDLMLQVTPDARFETQEPNMPNVDYKIFERLMSHIATKDDPERARYNVIGGIKLLRIDFSKLSQKIIDLIQSSSLNNGTLRNLIDPYIRITPEHNQPQTFRRAY